MMVPMKVISLMILSLSVLLVPHGEAAANKGVTGSKTLVMTPLPDTQRGGQSGYIPLPKSWRIERGSFVGPNGVNTTDFPPKNYNFQQRMLLPLEQVVREDLAPAVYQSGGRILGTFVIPEFQNYDRAYDQLLWKFGNPSAEFHALGVDTVSPDGNKTLFILRQLIYRNQYGGHWAYYINAIESHPSAYGEAKNDYIFALTHVQPDMAWINARNQREMARSNTSWTAHRNKMASDQAAFNATNKAWMESTAAISKMSMDGWRSRSDMRAAGHSSAVNVTLGEETIHDSTSGDSINVDAGSNRYFTNSNNEYIRTDDYFYEPGMDNSVNMYEWKEWQGN